MADMHSTAFTRPHEVNELPRRASDAIAAARVCVVRNRLSILDDVSIKAYTGETVAILGPNGAGKSTLLKCFTSAIRPDSGELRWFDGSSRYGLDIRRKIGFSGHEPGLYGELTVSENLVFAARMFGVERSRKCAESALVAASLSHISNKRVALLSQGLRQRVAILRSTIHDPLLILLDEPFASLDEQGRAWLESLFESWHKTGRTVCFVSHDVVHSRSLADRVVMLDRGRIVNIEETHSWPAVSRRSA
jgi:ABC-type multidrug transport system ATPase subunit